MEVAEAVLKKYKGKLCIVALAPNLRGAENAVKCGVEKIAYVISVSAAHNMKNVNRTHDESFEDMSNLIKTMPDIIVKLSLATSFGCPFEGEIPAEKVTQFIKRALDCGVKEIVLCDTIGIANPKQTVELVQTVLEVAADVPIGMHMHDTRGLGVTNMLAGMMAGVTRFETSVGGLGGCPFAPDSAGNTATEDAINMIHAMGIQTGVDLSEYMEAVSIVKKEIQANLSGHMGSVSCYAEKKEGD